MPTTRYSVSTYQPIIRVEAGHNRFVRIPQSCLPPASYTLDMLFIDTQIGAFRTIRK